MNSQGTGDNKKHEIFKETLLWEADNIFNAIAKYAHHSPQVFDETKKEHERLAFIFDEILHLKYAHHSFGRGKRRK